MLHPKISQKKLLSMEIVAVYKIFVCKMKIQNFAKSHSHLRQRKNNVHTKEIQRRVLQRLQEFFTAILTDDVATMLSQIAHVKDENGKKEPFIRKNTKRKLKNQKAARILCVRIPTGGGKIWNFVFFTTSPLKTLFYLQQHYLRYKTAIFVFYLNYPLVRGKYCFNSTFFLPLCPFETSPLLGRCILLL